MAGVGLLGDDQGDEELALGCRAPPEGREEPGGAPGGMGCPRGPRKGPPGLDSGGVANGGTRAARGRGEGRSHKRAPQPPPPGPAGEATAAKGAGDPRVRACTTA